MICLPKINAVFARVENDFKTSCLAQEKKTFGFDQIAAELDPWAPPFRPLPIQEDIDTAAASKKRPMMMLNPEEEEDIVDSTKKEQV